MNGLTAAIQGSAERESISQCEFTEIVQEHQSMVFSIALHYLGDRSSAEEVAQEVFLQLYRQMAKLSGPEHRTAWLRKVACHRSIDFVRRRKLEPRTKLDEIAEPAGEVRPDDPMLRQKLRKLIQSLPEKARMAMILRYQEDLYPEEIAGTMGIPVRTVKSLLHRSVALLRDKLGEAPGGGGGQWVSYEPDGPFRGRTQNRAPAGRPSGWLRGSCIGPSRRSTGALTGPLVRHALAPSSSRGVSLLRCGDRRPLRQRAPAAGSW